LDRSIGDDEKLGLDYANLTFARFPSLRDSQGDHALLVEPAVAENFDLGQPIDASSPIRVLLKADRKREKIMATLSQSDGLTISKILNTQGVSLRDLRMKLSISPD